MFISRTVDLTLHTGLGVWSTTALNLTNNFSRVSSYNVTVRDILDAVRPNISCGL